METNICMGQRIKERRLEQGLTLKELGSKIGVASSTIMRYENGTISKAKLPVIEAIARALDVNPAWLCCKSENKNNLIECERSNSQRQFERLMQYHNAFCKCSEASQQKILEYAKNIYEIELAEKAIAETHQEKIQILPVKEEEYLMPIAAHNDDTSEEQIKLMREDLEDL